jgi:hypothetical protein
MKTSSRKQKGRKLQQLVRDLVLSVFTELTADDVRSTGMGQSGDDLLLSTRAKSLFPYNVECKAQERIKVLYDFYEQACGKDLTPLLVIRSNHKPALAVLNLKDFMELIKNNGKETKSA